MTELLTAAQMRAIEEAAIASGEVTGLELMERAGRGVVEAIFEEWPELRQTSHRAVVLCGPGNNGGDGFVVARLLKEWGWEVEVFLYGDPSRLPPDARANYERWGASGELVGPIKDAIPTISRSPSGGWLVVVDALFGTGLKRALPKELGQLLDDVNRRGRPQMTVAVDLPSGLCSDSGEVLRHSDADFQSVPFGSELVCADLTVTLGFKKTFTNLQDGPKYTGHVRVVDIGLSKSAAAAESMLEMFDAIVRLIDLASGVGKDASAYHKYTHGHALILSGGAGRGGAARLAARGALRIGAGLVTVGCPPEALVENAARLDAVMLRPVADADALGRVLEDKRINALCLGPGLGTGEREVALVAAALGCRADARPAETVDAVGRASARHGRPLVLDADALTILAREPGLFAALHENCVLTPHAGEFTRLFPDIAEKLAAPATKGPAYSKVDATREASARAGCVVLYKGPDTVIADPSGRCSINSAHYDRAAPWLATAGSGDVLAGFIVGLLARGFAPMQAAETAAWLHVECALKFGPGLIAEDLPEQLPAVFRDLGL